MFDFNYTIKELLGILPLFIVSWGIVMLITPTVGVLAKRINAIDFTSITRRRLDKGTEAKTYEHAIPRLGGLAIVVTFLAMMYYSQGFNTLTIGVGTGLSILLIVGLIDDIKNLPGSVQFLFQVIAVLSLILIGVRIEQIDILGEIIRFDFAKFDVGILGFFFQFVFPADIITIIWFLVIINAMNWVSGIDGLEEAMAVIAGFTLMLLAIKFGNSEMLALSSIFTGSVLGFALFNYPPAHIFNGTIGNTALGYLLALLAIKIDGKMTTSLLLLALPLVDFIWVLFGRVIRYREFNPLKLMSISGKHHLHHRLMELGYSNKQVLYLEIFLFSFFAVAAYYLAGFNKFAVVGLASFSLLGFLFAILKIKRVKRYSKGNTKADKKKKGEIRASQEPVQPPDKAYAY